MGTQPSLTPHSLTLFPKKKVTYKISVNDTILSL